MNRLTLIFLLPILFCGVIKAQDLHTPAEIFELLDKSKISYSIEILKKPIFSPNRSNNILTNEVYRVEEEGRLAVKQYDGHPDTKDLIEQAERYFRNGERLKARETYLEILKTDPRYYKVMTYIGQTYGMEKDFDMAKEWYTRAIKINYIDYMAHWFLAEMYLSTGEIDKAVEEITIAQILNRNNPRIQLSLEKIYNKKKLKSPDWVFNPQYKLDSKKEGKVDVKFEEGWMGYALVKALWKYEPGYAESMGEKQGIPSIIEEKEAILSLLSVLDKKKIKKNPELKALMDALDNDLIDAYIFYEILLPQYPHIVYQLTDDFTNDIKDYVLQIRGGKKK